jgi:hypothetical protein
MVTRIAQRFGLSQETLWARLKELRSSQQTELPPDDKKKDAGETATTPTLRQAPARPHEVKLLEILLSEPKLVAEAQAHLAADQIEHPGLRLLVEGLYRLLAEGETPTLDHLRARIDNERLLAKALELQAIGEAYPDRQAALADLLRRFEERQQQTEKQNLQQQLHAAGDLQTGLELLRQLQNRTSG